VAKKHSKRYLAALKKLPDPEARYAIPEAVGILKKFDGCKFDETVEVSVNLRVDQKKTEQLIRGSFALPHGLGKEKKVIAFAEGPDAEACRQAGAAEVGGEDLAKKILDGWTDFDVAVAHPQTMKFVGKLGRVLGPQGKMPSPKSGTVTENVAQAVKEFKGGKIEYRASVPTPQATVATVQVPVGKKSFPADKLAENVSAFIEHVQHARPASAKGAFVEGASISATMSPGVNLALAVME
jgi:large subunit ribosomal protein L1